MYNGLSQVYCIKPEGRIHYKLTDHNLHGFSSITMYLHHKETKKKMKMSSAASLTLIMPEIVNCLLRLLHILNCTPDYFFHRSKHYEN